MKGRTLEHPSATVGRDPELASLTAAIHGAQAGRGGCVFLVGEAGSGKTRLLREAAGLAAASRLSVLQAEAPHALTPPPFGTAAAALRGWLRDSAPPYEELAPFAAGLRRILPEWPGGPTVGDPPAEQLRLLMLEAALRLMLVASRPFGAVVLLDDLHEADPETVELVHHAAGSVQGAPLLIIGTMRPGRPGPAEEEARALAQRGRAAIIDVEPLTRTGTASLIESIFGAPALDELVDDVFERTDGNPLLIEELVDAYVTAGSIKRTGDALEWAPVARALVPPTIVQTVRRRLESLDADARSVVGAAAVLGSFEEGMLAAVSQVRGPALSDALERAVDAGLLDDARGRVAFRHALIMDAAAEAMLETRKRQFHRRAAAALGKLHSEDQTRFEERARHLEAIGSGADAATMLLGAARRSLDVHAPASAEAALRHALGLDPDDETQRALRDALAEALTALGRWDEALRIDAQEVAVHGDDPARLARMARNALPTGRLDQADSLIERGERAGGSPGPFAALAALVALWRGNNERAVTLASRALIEGERADDSPVICDALDVLGRASDALGLRDEAIRLFRRWVDEAERAGLHASRLRALMELGNVEYMANGDPSALRTVRELARSSGALTTLVLADLSSTWCHGSRGELDNAVMCAGEAVDVCRRFDLDLLTHALVALGWAQGRRRADSGEEWIAEAARLAPDDPDVMVEVHELRGDSALRAGRYEEARGHYDHAMEVMRSVPSPVPAMTPYVRVCAHATAGAWDDAAHALDEARVSPGRDRISYNALWLEVAEALMARDPDALDDALSRYDGRAGFECSMARVLGAQILGGEKAARWLRSALDAFERAGAETDAAHVRKLMRRVGAPVPRARRHGSVLPALRERGVTKRQAEILVLVGKGLSNPEIAGSLYLSVRTIESHVSALMAKLEVQGRAGLIALALSLSAE